MGASAETSEAGSLSGRSVLEQQNKDQYPLPTTPLEVHGPIVPLPIDVDAHSFIFQSRLRGITNPYEASGSPDHTFDGEEIPPGKTTLLDHRSGASVSFARLREDSAKAAASLLKITGQPLSFDRTQSDRVLHSPRTTVLLHLPNSIPFAVITFAALRAHTTLSPISSLLTINEIAYTLAKARPRVIVTWRSVKSGDASSGKDAVLAAVHVLAGDSLGNDFLDDAQRAIARQWATQFEVENEARLMTVDLEADYYGTEHSRTTGRHASSDPQDWTHLLSTSTDDVQRILPSSKLSSQEQHARVAFLLWSSGSTGLPKAVLLNHKFVISQCISQWMKPHLIGPRRKGGERWIALAPWCHVFGLAAFLLGGVSCGATLILPRPGSRFDLRQFLLMLSHYRITSASVAPPVVVALRNTPLLDPKSKDYLGKLDLSALSVLIAGGAPISPDLIRSVYARLGKYVQLGYGASEAGGTTQCNALNLDQANSSSFSEIGSSGPPLYNLQIRIDPTVSGTIALEDIGKGHRELIKDSKIKRGRGEIAPLDPCVPGEILVKGDSLMLGYYSGLGTDELSNHSTSSVLDITPSMWPFTPEGWYRTGDWGCLDQKGNVWILGRSKETFKVRGFQVSPVELEAIFIKHDGIADVACCGMKLKETGFEIGPKEDGEEEVPVLFIQPSPSFTPSPTDSTPPSQQQHREAHIHLIEDLSQWIRSRTAYYKNPRFYVLVEGVEKNPTGKIVRRELPNVFKREKGKGRVFEANSPCKMKKTDREGKEAVVAKL